MGDPSTDGAAPPDRVTAWRRLVAAVLAYVGIAVAWTWPLSTRLGSAVPWDRGDSLLNAWILGWHYHQVSRVLRGDVAAFADWWHPNIFHPTRYAIGHSELLIGEALLGAPVQALTGNLLLTYNVVFLASFVLSAVGAYLFVRSLTRNHWAGFVAGLLYGFAIYRVAQGPHIQVLSSQWMPFALWALHRWWQTHRLRWAITAGAMVALQNLSNGYFLIYAALWLPPYVLAQIAVRRGLRSWPAWKGPIVAGVIALALTIPFLYPYLKLRELGQPARPIAAIVQYSADTLAWRTAPDQLALWGTRLRALSRPEGDLFPGVVPIALALIALGLAIRDRRTAVPPSSPLRRAIAAIAALSLIGHLVAIAVAIFGGDARVHLGPLVISITNGYRLIGGTVVSLALLFLASPRVRRAFKDDPDQPVVLWWAMVVGSVWLSFGPFIHIGGRVTREWPSLYAFVYQAVPGANGLRVPPRVAMVTALALSVLGGLAVAGLTTTRRRAGAAALALAIGTAFIVESWPAPVPVDVTLDATPYKPIDEPLPARASDHPLPQAIATLPRDAVLVDLPFGTLAYEVWWQYLSTGHWRARVNGFSGDVPPGFIPLEATLSMLPTRLARGEAGDDAAAMLRATGATHLAVHAGAWLTPEEPSALRAWLEAQGATPVATAGQSEIWALRR